MYPTTEEELISMVASASKNKRKVKAVTRFSHSIPKLVCPDGENGLLISTRNLNKIVKIDAEMRRMTAESGVSLRDIINEAAKAELALPYTPYWWPCGAKEVQFTSMPSIFVIVSPSGPDEGYAKLSNLHQSHHHLNAVLGVVSQVTLKLEPTFKRSLTYVTKDDFDLGDELVTFGRQHEFGDVIWDPNQQKAVYRIDDRVSLNTSGNGFYDFVPFRPTLSAALAVLRPTEELQETTLDSNGKCVGAKLITATLGGIGYGVTNNGVFLGYPVVSFRNGMQSSGTCLDSFNDGLITACTWNPRIKGEFFHQTTFSIPLSSIKNFIDDVPKLVELEPKSLCGLEIEGGILMRNVTASSAYLGKTEDAVDFDITYYRSKDPLAPTLFEDIVEEIEQIGLFKYGGSPHWGKDRNLAFLGAL